MTVVDAEPAPTPLGGPTPDYSAYHPRSPAVRHDPYPFYAHLRQHEPVRYVPDLNAFAVSRHADVRAVLLDHARFSSDPLIDIAFGEGNPAPNAPYMIASDPPDHTRLRTLVNKAFSRRALDAQRDKIEKIVADLIAAISAGVEFEFIAAVASPLPVHIIGQIMGIETELDTTFRRWSNTVSSGGEAANVSAAQRAEIRQDAAEFRDYFHARIDAARRRPRDDLISDLVQAEEAGDRLSAEEVLALCVLLLVAGNETTTGLLCNILVGLRDFPRQEQLVRADLRLLPNLTEEILRYHSPTQLLFRRATVATEICDVEISVNAIVIPIYGSANRDETVFAHADELDVLRTDLRQHMAFGWGIHLCVGQALALLESELAIKQLFTRFRRIEITQTTIDWCDPFYMRHPKALRVRCE